jgi:hypothetical protein
LDISDTSTQIPKIKGKILEDQCEKIITKRGVFNVPVQILMLTASLTSVLIYADKIVQTYDTFLTISD